MMEGRKYQVLIADDEEYVRDLLAKNIRNSDIPLEVVAVVGDGRAALEEAKRLRPEIVVTDISMPFINGLELIKELQKEGISSKNVIISGYDEFDYAKTAISLGVKDYLLKPFLPRELIDVLRKIVEELDNQKILYQNMSLLKEQAKTHKNLARERFLKELLNGREPWNDIDGYARGDELDISLRASYYLAGVFRFQGTEWDFGKQDRIEEFLMLIQDGYFASGIRLYAVSFDKTQLAVILCGEGMNCNRFMQLVQVGVEKVVASLEKYYHIRMTCGFGTVYQTIADIKQSYQEAIVVTRRSLDIQKQKPIVFYHEIEDKDEKKTEEDGNVVGAIQEWKSKIRLAVKAGRQEEALSLLDGLMKCYASAVNRKAEYIGVSVGELIYALANDMEAGGYQRESPEEIYQFEEKMKYGSLIDLKNLLESYIKKCCQNMEVDSDRTKANAMVRQLKMLIENHLKDSYLDLEWAAEQVHFSVSYVRQAFKQNTKESFGEYVIRKRMERAGMLLQSTSMRIQEVAEECGYDNQRYFASSFKKFYGYTPTEFKKLVEKEGKR